MDRAELLSKLKEILAPYTEEKEALALFYSPTEQPQRGFSQDNAGHCGPGGFSHFSQMGPSCVFSPFFSRGGKKRVCVYV